MKRRKTSRGDTLVEVMFAVGIFGLVAIGAIGIMNRGLYDAQKALEISMARNEIDAQAEGLRFIREAYNAEKNTTSSIYTRVWNALKSTSYSPQNVPEDFFTKYNGYNCDDIYDSEAFPDKAFVVNTRRLTTEAITDYVINKNLSPLNQTGRAMLVRNYKNGLTEQTLLEQTPVYPRLIYTNKIVDNDLHDTEEDLSDSSLTKVYYEYLTKAQGIWVVGVASDDTSKPEYYDFYIRTCWYGPGTSEATTISTTIRLSNPDK